MERLTPRDLRVVRDFLRECYALCDLDAFPRHTVSQLQTVVPAAATSYTEVNLRTGADRVGRGPPQGDTPDLRAIERSGKLNLTTAHPLIGR